MNRLVVTGGRFYGRVPGQRQFLFATLDHLLDHEIGPFDLIHGGAHGADDLAQSWAEFRGIETTIFKAKWKDVEGIPKSKIRYQRDGTPYNVAAGFDRNKDMIVTGKPTHGIAFRGQNGTEDMVSWIVGAKIPFYDCRGVQYP